MADAALQSHLQSARAMIVADQASQQYRNELENLAIESEQRTLRTLLEMCALKRKDWLKGYAAERCITSEG